MMTNQRGAVYRNIWWLLALLIVIGLALNYLFVKKQQDTLDLPDDVQVQAEENTALIDIITPEQPDALLDVQTWQVDDGLQVFYLPIDNLPIIDIQLMFAAGSAYDGDTPGLANITNQIIGKNTLNHDTTGIAAAFESQGAIFGQGTSRDGASISLRTLSFDEERDEAINMFTDVLDEIYFGREAFEIIRQRTLTAIAAQAQSPAALASIAFYQTIYADHPYATPVLGYENTVANMTLTDVINFYREYYNRQNAMLVIVGDINLSQTEALARRVNNALSPGLAAAPIPPVQSAELAILEHVDFPSSQQHILLGMPVLEKGNPDFFPFYVGNHVLGGSGLSSQLFDLVREQHGLAYSVGSQVATLKEKGPFVISLQTRSDESTRALSLVQQHLNDFLQHGPSPLELAQAKQNIAGSFLMAFDSNAALASHVATLAFYALPLDYYDDYLARVEAVTIDDIERVFNEYLDLQTMTIVTLGEDQSDNS